MKREKKKALEIERKFRRLNVRRPPPILSALSFSAIYRHHREIALLHFTGKTKVYESYRELHKQ
jgi:hypothetical protein